MKAIVLNAFGGTENFTLEDLPNPVPTGDELLIRIKAAAFNPIDYQMRLGYRESALMHSPVLGRELSGVVEAVGPDVKHFKTGDAVFAAAGSNGSNGSYAEYITLTEKKVALIPANLSFEQAAAVPSAGLTAWQTFSRLNVTAESSVFITGGSGAVGSFLIKLLRAHDVQKIVTIAGNEKSKAALKLLGLTDAQIINYHQKDFESSIQQANQQLPFDYAIDTVGGKASETAARLLKVNGIYADITFLGTEQTRELLFDKGTTVLHISNYAFSLNNNLSWYGQTLHLLKKQFEENKITAPAIDVVGTLSTETVAAAHTRMEKNLGYGQKLVMRI